MTMGQQVQRVGLLNGLSAGAARAAVDRTFARYELPATTRQRYPFQLSGGMARRVLVSTAVVTQADLVIADEPTPGLHHLDALGIHPGWLTRYPHELSGGELQRVAIARVLNRQTRYLIADEMTAMLDANTQALIWQVILEFARQNQVGVIAISHDTPLLKRLCHGVQGTQVDDGPIKPGLNHRILDLASDSEPALSGKAMHPKGVTVKPFYPKSESHNPNS
ncbi:MAG TPA: ATP-binding cassette domain-containing protein, partial [Nodosilinea sp.]|nr:ATP-binding cassette domain-containing protein [Nodosilinea sp.]